MPARKEPVGPTPEQQTIMDQLMSKLTERQLSKMTAPNVTKMFTRRMIQDAFLETFELIGGVPRLAIWANESENYEVFLRLLMILAPKEQPEKHTSGAVIEYRSAIPRSTLVNQTQKQSTLVDEDITDA
jgi:hypothetical protein